jgi:hypothetical protein
MATMCATMFGESLRVQTGLSEVVSRAQPGG